MATPPNAGNQVDTVARKKITVPLWVLAAVALGSNVIGAILHV